MTETNTLRGLALSAVELKELHPDWSDSFVEDYLNKDVNLLIVEGGVDDSMQKVPSAEEDNIATFDDAGQVKDSNVSIFSLGTRAYFYGRTY